MASISVIYCQREWFVSIFSYTWLFSGQRQWSIPTSGTGTAPTWSRANVLNKLKCRNTKSKFKTANKAVNGDVWSSRVGKTSNRLSRNCPLWLRCYIRYTEMETIGVAYFCQPVRPLNSLLAWQVTRVLTETLIKILGRRKGFILKRIKKRK